MCAEGVNELFKERTRTRQSRTLWSSHPTDFPGHEANWRPCNLTAIRVEYIVVVPTTAAWVRYSVYGIVVALDER